jgi:hypothetical protein
VSECLARSKYLLGGNKCKKDETRAQMVFLGASKEKVIPCCFTTVLLVAAIPVRITATITNDEALLGLL